MLLRLGRKLQRSLSFVLSRTELFHEGCWTLHWGKLINRYSAVVSGSITQLCRLPLLKCISVGLFIPVIFFSYTTILFLFIFPALSHKLNRLHLNFLLSHLSFFFLYLSHPTLDLVSLPSFPVHRFCLPCFEQTTVYHQRLRSSTFISLSDDEIVPRGAITRGR